MDSKPVERLARRQIPQHQTAVVGAGKRLRAVGAQGDSAHAVTVPLQHGDFFPGRQIPINGRVVKVGANQRPLSIGADVQAEYLIF